MAPRKCIAGQLLNAFSRITRSVLTCSVRKCTTMKRRGVIFAGKFQNILTSPLMLLTTGLAIELNLLLFGVIKPAKRDVILLLKFRA